MKETKMSDPKPAENDDPTAKKNYKAGTTSLFIEKKIKK